MLTEGDDGGKALYAVRNSEILREEARGLLPSLEVAKQPTSREAFALIMVKQRTLFGLGDKEAGEWSLVLEGFYEVLGEFSAAQIERAFVMWHRGEGAKGLETFFPQPRQLYPLAKKARDEIWIAYHRAKKALEGHEKQAPKVDAAERAQIAAGLKELAETLKMKTIPDDMKPRLTPAEVAQRLRDMAEGDRGDEVGIVL